jgi:PAS domain S-box-containing protein
MLLTIEMFPGTKRSIASLIDITDRKRIEEALRESEEKYRNLSETTHDVIVTTDFEGKITYANPAAKKLVGDQEIIGKSMKDFMHPHLVKRHQEMLEARRQGFSDVLSYEWHFISPKDGSTVSLDVVSSLLLDQGKPLGILFNAWDITDRRRVEEALRDSEEKYRAVAEGARDGIAVIHEGRLEYVNPCLAHMAGYSVEELTGSSFIEFVSKESVVDLLGVVKKAFAGEPVPSLFKTRIRHRDGTLIDIEVNGTPITWKGKKALLGFIRNTSGRTETEERRKGKKDT